LNNSKQVLRDVEIEILYSCQWKNEFRPGKDNPGRAVTLKIDKEIPPDQSVPFNYKPSPPLPVQTTGTSITESKWQASPTVSLNLFRAEVDCEIAVSELDVVLLKSHQSTLLADSRARLEKLAELRDVTTKVFNCLRVERQQLV
jgi:hypothetical protein